MVKNILALAVLITLATSCSTLKPINSASPKSASSESIHSTRNNDIKFIDNISANPEASNSVAVISDRKIISSSKAASSNSAIEKANTLQLKYAILLNTEVEQLQNVNLLQNLDSWYGTRYRMGGTSRSGVDCSAFVQAIFLGAYGLTLPRTAREQYKVSKRISRTELHEGDLVFFNTTGGVSHVGIYLQNNKFIHASASRGVTISDLFDPYYLRRFVGAGRLADFSGSLSAL